MPLPAAASQGQGRGGINHRAHAMLGKSGLAAPRCAWPSPCSLQRGFLSMSGPQRPGFTEPQCSYQGPSKLCKMEFPGKIAPDEQ